jgi:hypothetical protein
MAARQLVLIFQWENTKSFQLLAQEPGMENYLTIVRVEENSDLASLWHDVQDICEKYCLQQIKQIGNEMKE